MHLGILCNEYPPFPHGGIGSSNQDLAEGLVGLGHQVTVLGVYPASADNPAGLVRETINGVSVVRLYKKLDGRFYKLRSLFTRWQLYRLFRKEHASRPLDIIEIADYGGWLPWGGPNRVPVVARLQGTHALFDKTLGRRGDEFQYSLEKKTLLRSEFWLGISDFSFRETLEICGLPGKHGGIIFHAVDTDLFCPKPEDDLEEGLIVYVNVLNPKKGIEQLIDAANQLFGKYPKARLVVIGRVGAKGDGKKTYAELLQERVNPEIRDRVIFTGALDRRTGVLPWLRKAHVCCYPSHMETFGIAPVEAMSLGKPVIFSKAGPGPEVIEDGVSGLLCDPKSPGDIAAKIETLLTNPDLARELGHNGRQRVLERFNKKDWLRKNLEFFQCCLAGNVPLKSR